MKVAKFGGSSLATGSQVQKVAGIVREDPQRRIVVVSAPGSRHTGDPKVTDLLIELGRQKLAGEEVSTTLDRLLGRFSNNALNCGVGTRIVEQIEDDLRRRIDSPSQEPARFMDLVKAAGEDNNARLFAAVLRAQGQEAEYVNPQEAGLLLTEEAGFARVLPDSFPALSKLRKRQAIQVFPGFFGYSKNGHIVTFSRGGSDITGAILAAAVDADVYENFSDVDSVLAASPAFVAHPEPIETLTYREMRELSYAGFSVLHDEALEPVVHRGIPVNIRNTNRPEGSGTWIVEKRELRPHRPVTGIAAKDGFCTIYISKYLMNRAVGFGRRLLQVFENEGISYEHTPSGIDNMSIILRESFFPTAIEPRILALLEHTLSPDQITVERGVALIMLVGEGMQHAVGVTGRAGTAFGRAGVNIEMINQGSSEVSIMFGVKSEDLQPAVQALYQEFFQ